MSIAARRRLTRRQQYGLWIQFVAPPDLPRAKLEPLVPHLAADGLACALGLATSRLSVSLARTAADFVGIEGWKPYGYARLGDFSRERLDRSGRWLRDLAVLGVGLGRLPGLENALWGGDGERPLGRVAAIAVARVATEQTISDWIGRARRSTVRSLLEAIRASRRVGSDLPVDASAAEPTVPAAAAPTSSVLDSGGELHRNPANGSVSDRTSDSESRVVEEEIEDIDTFELKLAVPEALRVAFEETLDLHRAVTGYEASVESFVEALAAEAAAGLSPPDVSLVPTVAARKARDEEERLAREFHMWTSLGMPIFPGVELARGLVSKMNVGAMRCDASQFGGAATPGTLAGVDPMPFDPTATEVRPEMGAVRALLRRIETLSRESFCGNGDLRRDVTLRFDTPQLEAVLQLGAPRPSVNLRPDAAGRRDADDLARRLQTLVSLEDEIERRLGCLLAEMNRRRDWSCLHFTSLGHYAEQRLGMCRRTAERRAGIVRVLRRLPIVLAAYESGAIGLQAAWLLHGILDPRPTNAKIERAWVARAREATLKRLRDEARWVMRRKHRLIDDEGRDAECQRDPSHDEGHDAESRRDPSASIVDSGNAEAHPEARPDVPLPPSDAAWHASLRRTPGMSRRRVARLGWQALRSTSDNVFLRLRLTEGIANAFLASVEGARRHLEESVRAKLDPTSGSPPSRSAAGLFGRRGQSLPAWVGLLALLEDYVGTWDDPRAQPRRRWSQTYERDSWRCMAPGCTARCWIQDHHIDYRSARGSDALWNQLSLCRFHHLQGEHGILARCRGRAPLDVVWRLGTKDLGVWYRNERRLPSPTTDRSPETMAA